MSDDGKLRVPDPEGPEEPDEAEGLFVLIGVVTLLLGLSFFIYRYQAKTTRDDTADARVSASEVGNDAGRSEEALRETALRLERRRRDEGGLPDHDWSTDELVAAFRLGHRGLSESACRSVSRKLIGGTLPKDVAEALRESLARRSMRAPWTCLFEQFFAADVELPAALQSEVDAVWSEVRRFERHLAIFESVVDGFRARRSTPDSDEFRRWLRLCGLNFDRAPGESCRRLLAELAPAEGADLLGVVERHVRSVELNPSYDLPIIIDGLGSLARAGQPREWRIEQTDELPAYDVDLRIGAIFFLCRFANSPNDGVADRAARALSSAAEVGVRAVDRKLVPRWRRTCRRAFGQPAEESAGYRAPVLGVWNGQQQSPPRYDLKWAIERGDCQRRDGHPFWYCGSVQWNADGPSALIDFFVETRSMEWEATPSEPTR